MITFATFWHGSPLSAFEQACLCSVVRRGYSVTVYSYHNLGTLPGELKAGDASEIAPQDMVQRFIYDGRPNLSHFSDFFRYNLFDRTSHIWIDADMLMLRPLDFEVATEIIAMESPTSICGAIMRLNPGEKLDLILNKIDKAKDRDLIWGETGPRLLTEIFGEQSIRKVAHPPNDFFPISHNDFWRVFLPSERDWCESRCKESFSVHLWNNIVDRLGIWKRIAPPAGSWLAARYEADGTAGMFDASYPPEVMRRMIDNWILRKSGDDLGIKSVARQFVPSLRRSARSYIDRLR
ncbi:hypothetical protein Mrad2831_1169 [Methylobacterium radiotolerans JCM 2831]|uniref:Alpha 1,4-glycosyltransferase domain-containing protein n=1 Tax=Methylobacterium radiotolerans (strain ATCC 27329 / DSM 1819 / JCM 2831 / NBRC 15690 / NCIMB 10815 / 0-1) TaxID=426355 RepID=B1M1Z1_METRJ|nr:hypothetical protein Mrad2831_1169 [Methylobacterium radiotolerans JCM 2831]